MEQGVVRAFGTKHAAHQADARRRQMGPLLTCKLPERITGAAPLVMRRALADPRKGQVRREGTGLRRESQTCQLAIDGPGELRERRRVATDADPEDPGRLQVGEAADARSSISKGAAPAAARSMAAVTACSRGTGT